ncbi:MAG TPA: hypothetical protein VK724_23125 [Bryobacteraceae bacterium]|nr:hypothetical protein [Bryobacteraceae bacterium]
MDLDNLDEVWHPSRFAPFFIAHRRELNAIWTASGRMDHLDWDQVPEQIRQRLKIVWNVAVPVVWVFALLFAWGQARHHVSSQLVKAGYTALLFAWEAIFFTYGNLSADNKAT